MSGEKDVCRVNAVEGRLFDMFVAALFHAIDDLTCGEVEAA
jgi:hypothetical protein